MQSEYNHRISPNIYIIYHNIIIISAQYHPLLRKGLLLLLPNFSVLCVSGPGLACDLLKIVDPTRYLTTWISSACPYLPLRQGFTSSTITTSSQASYLSPLMIYSTVPDVLNFRRTSDFRVTNFIGECACSVLNHKKLM